jgi:hypothetical protein
MTSFHEGDDGRPWLSGRPVITKDQLFNRFNRIGTLSDWVVDCGPRTVIFCGLFFDAVSVLDSTAWNGRMIGELERI